MEVETTNISAQLMNQNFINKVEGGMVKEAQEAGSGFIRAKLREDGIARRILPPQMITETDLDRDVYTDQPKIIVDKEIDSIATWVPFRGTGSSKYFEGPRYEIFFGKVESERFAKSKYELMTYKHDIRKVLQDNSVKDMQAEEDGHFMDSVRKIIADSGVQEEDGFGQTPFNQEVAGGSGAVKNFQPDTIPQGLRLMLRNKLPVGAILMRESLFIETLRFVAADVGDRVASDHYEKGIPGKMGSRTINGIPVITTIKDENEGGISEDEIYVFAPPQYLGKFYMIQDATLFIKQEADIIQFYSYESLGFGIGNTKSVIRINLNLKF